MCNMRNCDKSNGLLLSLGATNCILGKCAKSLSGKIGVTNGTTYDMVCIIPAPSHVVNYQPIWRGEFIHVLAL